MITITQVVQEIVQSDEIAFEAMQANILNFSAYADRILPEVEKLTLKTVRRGSIVVALHRLSNSIENMPPLKPSVRILDLSIKSPLFELTFDRSIKTLEKVSQLPENWFKVGFFTLTAGLKEITIICSQQLREQVMEHFTVAPVGVYDNLVAVTLTFDEAEYIEQPNIIFSLISALAGKRINIIEIVSTFTEISFIVRKNEMDDTVRILQRFFHSEK